MCQISSFLTLMKHQPLVAELLGTFLLTLVVLLSLGSPFIVPTPVLAGLTVGLVVYLFGSVSGAHINPAVTIALYVLKKIDARNAVWYVVMQMAGAFLASWVGMMLLGDAIIAIPVDSVNVLIAEAIGAAVLVMCVASVVFKKVDASVSGLTIGTALVVGAHIASVSSNGILNPAVALGIGSLSWMYAIGPVIGGIIAGYTYQWILSKK